MKLESLLGVALQAAVQAGAEVLDVYDSDIAVSYKSDDSPLTLADTRSHQVISRLLKPIGIPLLSEEGRDIDYAERQQWERLWVIDPLDGTKEFIKRNGEFTVNIALVENRKPILGVIFVPVKNRLYFGAAGIGAFRIDQPGLLTGIAAGEFPVDNDPGAIREQAKALPLKDRPDDTTYRIVGSRSHSTPELETYVAQKKTEYPQVEFLSAGSSLKFCLVAEGMADVYPRLGPTMEWDTAAGQAIAEQSGCRVWVWGTREPLGYNRENLLNPYFVLERTG